MFQQSGTSLSPSIRPGIIGSFHVEAGHPSPNGVSSIPLDVSTNQVHGGLALIYDEFPRGRRYLGECVSRNVTVVSPSTGPVRLDIDPQRSYEIEVIIAPDGALQLQAVVTPDHKLPGGTNA